MIETERNVSAFEARTHLGELLDYIRYSKKPCLIERHGRPVAALIDIKTYNEITLPQRYRRFIEEACRQIKDHYGPERIVLFGSAATGEITEGSDIDMLIIKETPLRRVERAEEVLSLVSPENPLEPHVYTKAEIGERLSLGDPFIKGILEKGKVLYEK